VSALVRAELLKLRTTRARFAYPLALLVLAGIGTAGTVGSAVDDERGTAAFQGDVVGTALVATLLALILGITIVTTEFRHGTATPTFLITPVRERVLGAKALAALLAGAALALLALVIVAAIAVPWLLALGHDLHLGDGDVSLRALQVIVSAALWCALGAAIGAAVHSQIGAIVGAIIWLLIVENLVIALLEWRHWGGVGDYLPGAAADAVGGAGAGSLDFWPALGVTLAYVAVIGAVGAVRTRRRDVT
jgi:ABC-2 type transport system permease protein